jgi:hypothetical protein
MEQFLIRKRREKMRRLAGIKHGIAVVVCGIALSGGRAVADDKKVEIVIPDWLASTEFSGDIRLRQQWDEISGKDTRSRQRIRLRLNGVTAIGAKLKVGYGLATGGSDPRSTNQTLDNNFETPDIRLNNAYVVWMPFDGFDVWGGKYSGVKHMMWRPTDLLWDSDITPDGAGVDYKYKNFFSHAGYLIADELKSESDPGLGYAQAGVKLPVGDNAEFRAAGVWYIPNSLQGSVMDHSDGNNSTNESGGLLYDFNCLQGIVELSGRDILGLDKAALMADYVINTDPDDDNVGWDAGIKLKKSIVSFKYNYRYLEKDAFVDTYPDSDAADGMTGVKGHEAEVKFAVYKNTSVNVDYYHMTQVDGDKDWDILQLDLVVKF